MMNPTQRGWLAFQRSLPRPAGASLRVYSRELAIGDTRPTIVSPLHCVGQKSTTQDQPAISIGRQSRTEAVLFLAREPLSLRKLAQLANLADATEARTVVRKLRERYDARGCAFQIAQVAGGYRLLTRREFSEWL